jgi:hypothetical protein
VKVYDTDNYFTGDYTTGYQDAVAAKGNISAAAGEADLEQFGTGIEYDKVIVLEGTNWPIDENTVLFVDKEPDYAKDDANHVHPIYNYVVVRVAKSLNHITLAIKRAKR